MSTISRFRSRHQTLALDGGTTPVDPWSFYREVTIDNTGGGAKTNWPVRIELTAANFDFADALSTGYDLQFRADDGVTVYDNWREFYDDATDTAALWVLVPLVGSGAVITIRLYYGNPAGIDTSDGDAVFPNLFEDFVDVSRLTGPLEQAVTPTVGNWNRFPNIAQADPLVPWREDDFREMSRIIYDPTDAVRPYKLYVTGLQSPPGNQRLGLYSSLDGLAWSEYGSNPVSTADIDDLCFMRDGSTIHGFVEFPGSPGASGVVVRRYTSADNGLTWVNQGTVVGLGTAGAWDDDRVGSPCVESIAAGGFVMVFDGAGTGGGAGQEIGAATSPTLGGTWTKVAGNPLLNTGGSSVPLDLWRVGNTWWMLTWTTQVVSLYTCVVADPTAWVAGSWTLAKASFVNCEGTLALAENTDRNSGVASRIGNVAASNIVRHVDFLGNTDVQFERFNIPAPIIFTTLIEAHSSELLLDPRTAGGASTVRWFNTGLTNDWAVGVRLKKVAQTAGNFARFSVGSGASTSVGGSAHLRQQLNSYGLAFGTEGGTNTVLNSVVAGVASTLGAMFNNTDFPNYHRYELRHTGTTLSYTRDGTGTQSRTVSTHDAASKDVMVSQGRSSGSAGAISTYDWIYARPFDGVDPAIVVGPEIAT